ncbi:hypothetical protein PN36_05860 [Candidatus Thiomargarita nelsonii]|uniref:Uncharacterized protein n=1 Tax=Candidatus Thiomargarita nelsonii TaxID=1003181 RepID=A0A4E0RKE9_9GAMM|nr:hypothetical protein PN36_05860 [Candidatus Thiomargarita nelsonii]
MHTDAISCWAEGNHKGLPLQRTAFYVSEAKVFAQRKLLPRNRGKSFRAAKTFASEGNPLWLPLIPQDPSFRRDRDRLNGIDLAHPISFFC